jgi:ubiquinone/menaquinone biosynthesis C-methylase UbiE
MPDVYAAITEVDRATQARLAEILELRAADPQQRAMVEQYLSEIELPKGARALEVGCGPGPVTRRIAQLPDIGEVLGLDPSPVFVEKAQELGKHLPKLSFRQGDGRSLEFTDLSFDFVLFHTSLCHIPQAEKALQEAHRVLRPNGWLVAFDGDYVTATVAIADFDPLQPVVEAMIANFVHDRWLPRRLPKVLAATGFAVKSTRSYGFTQTAEPTYMLTIVDRGADLLAANGVIAADAADALKLEARRRIKASEFFGHISFVSVVARKRA